MSALAKRYARAALEVATPSGDAERLAAELQAFVAAMAQSAALQEVLRNPSCKDGRPAVLETLGHKLGLAPLTQRLIALLARNDRLSLTAEVAAEVEAQADARAGRLRARVRSAVPLSEAQRGRIRQALEQRLGRPAVLTAVVEPELMGGLVCQIGDLTFDSSLRRQLELLTERLDAQAI